MSDSFADLWASTAPAKSIEPPPPQKKLGSTIPQRRQQYDAFSILSASQPSSRPAANKQPSDRHARQPQPAAHGDAFSTLYTSSLDGIVAGPRPGHVNMTMAERATLAQKDKVARHDAVPGQGGSRASSASLWDGLDALVGQTATSPSPLAPTHGGSTAEDSFDLTFDSALATGPVAFVHADRSAHSEDDDILGELGKPVSHSPSPPPPLNSFASRPAPSRSPRTASSPPPHITGQLVEMGFSPGDARDALMNSMTESGFDVQAAAELLVSQADEEASPQPSSHLPEHERHEDGDQVRNRNRDRATRRPPPAWADSPSLPPNFSPTPVQSQSQPQLDITAEKLLSQASEIGRGMFSRANALWKEGRERAVRIYEERAATSNIASALDGRPRWMRDNDHVGNGWKRQDQSEGRDAVRAGFKDDENEEEEKQFPSAHRSPPSQLQSQSQLPQWERNQEINLFGTDPPITAYQSPHRRRKPQTQELPPSTQSSSVSAPASPPQTAMSTSVGLSMPQSPPRPPPTLTTTIALAALAASSSHKSAGTNAYKRGDFPVALVAYVRALSALPPEHVLRVPILTNVALVRTKLGELKETIKACEEAIMIVRRFVSSTNEVVGGDGGGEMSFTGTESDFDVKMPVGIGLGKVDVSVLGAAKPNEDLPACIDLAEGLSKAYRRRAEALEGLEKWGTARSTWEALLSVEWAIAGAKGEAIKGVGRCRKMMDKGGDGGDLDLPSWSAPAKPKPKSHHNSSPDAALHPRPKPKSAPESPASSLQRSAALAALHSTHEAQQIEDAARLARKDAVDARLTAWKSGREDNIRALLTSLDESVLWPELGWRKVGMAEVVSKGQVKGAYVRAIARVHPDKLHVGNTTVEQRMIANGVFGALNEAWSVFQQQQQC